MVNDIVIFIAFSIGMIICWYRCGEREALLDKSRCKREKLQRQ